MYLTSLGKKNEWNFYQYNTCVNKVRSLSTKQKTTKFKFGEENQRKSNRNKTTKFKFSEENQRKTNTTVNSRHWYL